MNLLGAWQNSRSTLIAIAILAAISPLFGETTSVLHVKGGNVETIVFDPNNSNTVFAGGQGGGVFKSVDAGATWTTLYYLPVGQHSTQSLVVSKNNSGL